MACTECVYQQSNGQDRACGSQKHAMRQRRRQHWRHRRRSQVVVGRRRSHRADVLSLRPRPQCPGSPPCPWLGPPWSLVPWSGTVGSAMREGRDCFSTFCIVNVPLTHATRQLRPSRRASPAPDGARSWHQRPWRAQPRARRAAWALWARPEHVGSMAASSADDHLTVGGDANVVVSARPWAAA